MEKVLVTGASGFIGTTLVQSLCKNGFHVIATDRFAPHKPLPAAQFLQGDLLDDSLMKEALREVKTVYHLAALASIARAPEAEYERVNVQGTRQLLAHAQHQGITKFVHMSSSTVYGIPQNIPLNENAPIQPKNPYSRSKADAEQQAMHAGKKGLDVSIIRPRVVLGTGRAGIFALLFSLIRKGLPIPLPGGGKNHFQFTAVRDLVDACMLTAQERSPGECQIYNIGSDVERPMIEELRELIRVAKSRSRILPLPADPVRGMLWGMHKIGISPLVPEQYQIMDTNFVLDTTRAKEKLRFKPKHQNGDGLIEAWHWWTENTKPGGWGDLVRFWKPRHQNALQDRSKL
jgi:nucleoside-diphosphate-sugar epimerase